VGYDGNAPGVVAGAGADGCCVVVGVAAGTDVCCASAMASVLAASIIARGIVTKVRRPAAIRLGARRKIIPQV
jgi:hypothetical protein